MTLNPRESAQMRRLAGLLRAHAPHDGSFELRIPGVYAIRAGRPNAELVHVVQSPGLCIVAQGAKRVMLGSEIYEYDESRMLIYSVDVPVAAQVTRASPAALYLSLRLDLDPLCIAELMLKVYPHGLPPIRDRRAMYVTGAHARRAAISRHPRCHTSIACCHTLAASKSMRRARSTARITFRMRGW